jgi:hypothetical protein
MSAKFFIGAPVENIDTIPVNLRSIFITNDSHYLSEIKISDKTYLGKYLDYPSKVDEIELLQLNVLSLLQKILPQHTYKLKVFASAHE